MQVGFSETASHFFKFTMNLNFSLWRPDRDPGSVLRAGEPVVYPEPRAVYAISDPHRWDRPQPGDELCGYDSDLLSVAATAGPMHPGKGDGQAAGLMCGTTTPDRRGRRQGKSIAVCCTMDTGSMSPLWVDQHWAVVGLVHCELISSGLC